MQEDAAFQIGRGLRAKLGPGQDIGRADEVGSAVLQAQFRVAAHGPAGYLDDHVDIAGLQRRETLCPAHRNDLQCIRRAENCGGQRFTEFDVEPGPFALVIDLGKTEIASIVSRAQQRSAFLDRGNGRTGVRGPRRKRDARMPWPLRPGPSVFF